MKKRKKKAGKKEMAKAGSKQKEKRGLKTKIKDEVHSETLRASLAILFAVVAVVFSMAAFNLAGRFGTAFYEFAHGVLGVGYFLIPVTLLMVSVAIYTSKAKKIGLVKTTGAILFFLTALSLLELFFAGSGGKVGHYILYPFVYAFDKIASGVILVALASVATFITLDTLIKWVGLLVKPINY